MRRHFSFTAALLFLLTLSFFAQHGAAEVDTYDEEGYGEEATNTVGLEYDDDYDPAVGEDTARSKSYFPRACDTRFDCVYAGEDTLCEHEKDA